MKNSNSVTNPESLVIFFKLILMLPVVHCSLAIFICFSLLALSFCVSVLLLHNFTGIPKLHLLKST